MLRIAGHTMHERAVNLAGFLAERGVKTIAMKTASGQMRELHARTTDLPGELERACPCELTVLMDGREVRIVFTESEVTAD